MNDNANINTTTRPCLAFYHANAKGTGCAIKMELHPACGISEGFIGMTLANQITVGNRVGPNPTFPRFDWENKGVVKLCFDDLCKMLQVFRGECESINDGKGLWHRTAQGNTRISLNHHIEPVHGYSIEVCLCPVDGGEERRWNFFASCTEALGLCEAFAGSMYLVAFGIPHVG